MDFVFEFAADSRATFKKGDVVDVFEESRITLTTKPKRGPRAKDALSKMPRTNYALVTGAPVDITLSDMRAFVEPVYFPHARAEDPHSGGIEHHRRWHFKNLPGGKKDIELTWAEFNDELFDKTVDKNLTEITAGTS